MNVSFIKNIVPTGLFSKCNLLFTNILSLRDCILVEYKATQMAKVP